MLFNSLEFGALLASIAVAWHLSGEDGKRNVLLAGSYLFYAGWNPWFCLLLAFSTLLDHRVALALGAEERPGARRALLGLSLLGNLGVLAYFKYGTWILANLGLAEFPGMHAAPGFHIYGDIPPGISFYTFQTLSYTLDVYWRKARPVRSLRDFALYVAFFPQLVAGPILRANEFFPQLEARKPVTVARTLQAAELFTVGLFKKVVIADNLGLAVDRIFVDTSSQSAAAMVLGGLMFWAQVYCDFSGYSTMARGLGKAFGFDLPRNFDFPILASDPLQYRRGWHVTMSDWFRDYVFHPLGGTRRGPARVALNVMIVWAAFGLWHGAAWTFVAWGLYNGAIQAANRERLRRGWEVPAFAGRRPAGMLLNLCFIIPSAIVFRSPTLSDGLVGMGRVMTLSTGGAVGVEWVVFLGVLGVVHVLSRRFYQEDSLSRMGWGERWVLVGGATLVVVLAAPETRPFVYFQF